jgi:hypothetical protein
MVTGQFVTRTEGLRREDKGKGRKGGGKCTAVTAQRRCSASAQRARPEWLCYGQLEDDFQGHLDLPRAAYGFVDYAQAAQRGGGI